MVNLNNQSKEDTETPKYLSSYDYEVIYLGGFKERGKVVENLDGSWEVKKKRVRRRKSNSIANGTTNKGKTASNSSTNGNRNQSKTKNVSNKGKSINNKEKR